MTIFQCLAIGQYIFSDGLKYFGLIVESGLIDIIFVVREKIIILDMTTSL